jgi:hypothetical protein
MDFFNMFKKNQPIQSRTMKGRVKQKEERLNAIMNSPSSKIDDFMRNMLPSYFTNSQTNEKYGMPQNQVNLLGLLGGPLGLGFGRVNNELNKIPNRTGFGGGGGAMGGGGRTGGVRTGGGNYFDLIMDILKRQGVIK